MESLGHTSLPPTALDRQDNEEATSGKISLRNRNKTSEEICAYFICPIYLSKRVDDSWNNRKLLGSVVPARISSQSSRHCWRSPLPHASALIQRDFGYVLGAQQTKQLPHVAKVDLVWQLGV
ncbi:hypothetical protein TNCV_301591 [Trichonephila clavipes]|nr:hypothetical protein TNCV_301591 [Trichonephila clavipes]